MREAVKKPLTLSYAQVASKFKKTIVGIPLPAPVLPSNPEFADDYFNPEPGHIYIDGACLNNGEPNATAGVGVFFGPGEQKNIARRLMGKNQSSCRAEIQASVEALKITKGYLVDAKCSFETLVNRMEARDKWIQEYKNPTMHTDSQYLIDAHTTFMDGWIKTGRTNSGRIPKNLELLKVLQKLSIDRKITWVFVPSHSGDPGNDAADLLAKAGAKHPNIPYLHNNE
jgi:ribonuclease HI